MSVFTVTVRETRELTFEVSAADADEAEAVALALDSDEALTSKLIEAEIEEVIDEEAEEE